MGLRSFIAWQKLGLRLRKVENVMAEEAVKGYDPKITAAKALAGLGKGAGAVILAGLIGYMTNAPAITQALHDAGLSDALVAALVPLLVALASAASNWAKHSAKE